MSYGIIQLVCVHAWLIVSISVENKHALNSIVLRKVSPGMINNPIYSGTTSDPVYESIHSHHENQDSAAVTQQHTKQTVMQPSSKVCQNLIYFYGVGEQSCLSKHLGIFSLV